MLTAEEEEFERQLEIFHSECDAAVRFFYTGYALKTLLHEEPSAAAALGRSPIFWNTTLDALKASTLITLGRVFDPNPTNHSLTRLVKFAHSNMQIFGKRAFRARMRGLNGSLQNLHEPTTDDFRRLKRLIADRRRQYESLLRPWRHELYAHRVVKDSREFKGIAPYIDGSNMQKLVTFLPRVHGSLWRLYYDGQKPVLRPNRYSVEKILKRPLHEQPLWSLQEKIIHETTQLLESLKLDA